MSTNHFNTNYFNDRLIQSSVPKHFRITYNYNFILLRSISSFLIQYLELILYEFSLQFYDYK